MLVYVLYSSDFFLFYIILVLFSSYFDFNLKIQFGNKSTLFSNNYRIYMIYNTRNLCFYFIEFFFFKLTDVDLYLIFLKTTLKPFFFVKIKRFTFNWMLYMKMFYAKYMWYKYIQINHNYYMLFFNLIQKCYI